MWKGVFPKINNSLNMHERCRKSYMNERMGLTWIRSSCNVLPLLKYTMNISNTRQKHCLLWEAKTILLIGCDANTHHTIYESTTSIQEVSHYFIHSRWRVKNCQQRQQTIFCHYQLKRSSRSDHMFERYK